MQPSSQREPQESVKRETAALRIGAAAAYLFVGLGIGICIALGFLAFSSDRRELDAGIVFGTSIVCAVAAAAFPGVALQSLYAFGHFVWGLLNGLHWPEHVERPDRKASKVEQMLFWLGLSTTIVVICALWLWRYQRSAA